METKTEEKNTINATQNDPIEIAPESKKETLPPNDDLKDDSNVINENQENSVEKETDKKANFLEYGVTKIDEYFTEHNIIPNKKRKFKETSKIHGIVYKFSHFGIEVVEDQVTIFGKYKSEFFDTESYESNDKLLESLLPRIQEYYNNPALTKHPVIRYFSNLFK